MERSFLRSVLWSVPERIWQFCTSGSRISKCLWHPRGNKRHCTIERKEKKLSPMSINFKNFYLEDRDRGADDEDEDVCHGEVDKEHVDHSLEAGACGHWQDDLTIRKCQRGFSLWFWAWSTLIKTRLSGRWEIILLHELRRRSRNKILPSLEHFQNAKLTFLYSSAKITNLIWQ